MSAANQTSTISEPVSKPKIFIRLLVFLIICGAILFGLAGSLRWLWGWVFLIVFAAVTLASSLLVKLDQELVEERTTLKDDVKQWDKYLAGSTSLLYPFAYLIVAGLDYRFGWTGEDNFALWLKLLAVVIGLLGYGFSIWAARVNKFYARFVRIQTERGHHPVTTGPYRIVRHPGYAGLSLFILASGIILESYWAMLVSVVMVVILIVRTALEDRTLQQELPGYREYAQQTRYRLLPGIW